MSSSPALSDPADRAAQRDEDAQYYRAILHELVEMAADIARTVHRQAAPKPSAEQSAAPAPGAAAQPQPPQPDPTPACAPAFASAFDRIARTIRRTIALARKLSEPSREAPGPKLRSQDCPTDRCAEDCDECCPSARQRRTDSADTDALNAEPCERPEELDSDVDEDLDDALDDQSFADLIASLRHDSGLATLTDAQLRQRRTPQGTREAAQEGVPGEMCGLCTRAARPPEAGSPGSGTTGHPESAPSRTGNHDPVATPPAPPGTGPPEP